MSEERILLDYLNDILESICDIRDFTAGMNREDFSNDKKTIKAVVRSFEVIGEAASKLPHNIREMYPEIPWQETIAMRNRLIHEYFGVDLDIVWQTIEEDLEPLEKNVKRIIEETT
ncbi:MAG: hypothetical protein A2077_04855 [Nitrospirae bacterium GWC2_46_6]|nr:MAG: hypothetical protein A2077_04855 [Nitrospirae bacterium GWC2_46_6]OGW21665.1 MAG: hypothetical protein A2Z82_03430 [Nitrospirae bacterium GWA2_46_11]OGW24365.1 MAG: hypothetical protein A2X55_00235 [Nitrospirae bacterium GWB2_47_37]HAK88387.1 DUF86 domain-containing protein [Nitrospiraceae bacterium]HCL81124.1 DUF86 domain-containing protein [Nitrospiraceae bacterium]